VDGIAVTGQTYEQTKRILQSRYGDKNRIIQVHVDSLGNLKVPGSIQDFGTIKCRVTG
jgi:hypothetical protein